MYDYYFGVSRRKLLHLILSRKILFGFSQAKGGLYPELCYQPAILQTT